MAHANEFTVKKFLGKSGGRMVKLLQEVPEDMARTEDIRRSLNDCLRVFFGGVRRKKLLVTNGQGIESLCTPPNLF